LSPKVQEQQETEKARKATLTQSIRHLQGEGAGKKTSQGSGWRPQVRLVRTIKAC